MSNTPQILSSNMPLFSIRDGIICYPIIMPTNDNGQLAVVQCAIIENGIAKANFGTANTQTSNTSDIQKIINDARQDALANTDNMSCIKGSSNTSKNLDAPFDVEARIVAGTRHNAGGGNKKASDGQHKLIATLCKSANTSPSKIAMSICNKNYSEITGADAHAIIQHFKK